MNAVRILALGCFWWLACGDDVLPDDVGRDGDCFSRVETRGACQRDSDCGGAVCARVGSDEDDVAVTLECSAAGPAGTRCASGDECAHGLCTAASVCVEPCAEDGDCADRCADVWVHAGDDAMQRARACVARVALPEGATFERASLPVSRDVPLGGAGLHVVIPCGPMDARRLLTGERVLFDRDTQIVGSPAPLAPFFSVGGSTLAIALPSGPTYEPAATHSLVVAEAVAAERFDLSGPGGTVLDLDVFFVGVGLEPEGERGPAMLASALDRVDALYAPAGIRIGRVRQHRVVGAIAGRLAVLEGERGRLAEQGELFGLTASLSEPSIALFLVRDLDYFLALSGGIPGPLGVPGTGTSGVVVGIDALDGELGRILAHELGHHLGLFHLVELDGTVLEPLPDTPECPVTADMNGDGVLQASECATDGATNLMFWSMGGEVLTGDQSAVLRRAVVLRP